MNNKKLFFASLIALGFILVGVPSILRVASACCKLTYNQWVQRQQKKEAYFDNLAVTKPNVYRNYIVNSVLSNDPNSLGAKVAATAAQRGYTVDVSIINNLLKQNFLSCWPNCTSQHITYDIPNGTYFYNGTDPAFASNGNVCVGWGCFIPASNGKGNNPGVVVVPPDFTPPPGWTPPPNWTPPFTPLPSNQPVISEFKITNFTQRTDASSGVPFYFILSPQMQAGYKANIAWSVSGATSCTASCVYKDENGTQLPDQPGQANDCQWWGTVDPNGGNQGVQPKWQGTVQYTLTCQNGTLSDSKTFNAAIRQFSWQEVLGNQIAKFAALFR